MVNTKDNNKEQKYKISLKKLNIARDAANLKPSYELFSYSVVRFELAAVPLKFQENRSSLKAWLDCAFLAWTN
jgi:hypothetical protein